MHFVTDFDPRDRAFAERMVAALRKAHPRVTLLLEADESALKLYASSNADRAALHGWLVGYLEGFKDSLEPAGRVRRPGAWLEGGWLRLAEAFGGVVALAEAAGVSYATVQRWATHAPSEIPPAGQRMISFLAAAKGLPNPAMSSPEVVTRWHVVDRYPDDDEDVIVAGHDSKADAEKDAAARNEGLTEDRFFVQPDG